jgi:hypothetical protein
MDIVDTILVGFVVVVVIVGGGGFLYYTYTDNDLD